MTEENKKEENAADFDGKFQDIERELSSVSDVTVLDLSTQEKQIAELTEENGQLKDKFIRTLSELENTRRIAKEEKEKNLKYAITNFANDLIPAMENFYLAFSHQEREKNWDVFFAGITLVFNDLKKVFERNNLKRISPLNEKFDPNLHQAVSYVENEGEEDMIIEVLQAGYTLYDRVLKPAMVVVSKGKK